MSVSAIVQTCQRCGAQLAPSITACPGCGTLVHADQLAGLAQSAREAETHGDITAALVAWREALTLLPVASRQHAVISEKINVLGDKLRTSGSTPAPAKQLQKSQAGKAAGLGAIGLMLLKFKTLLLGLTKATTLLSVMASLGVYWTIWGWKFALGLVLSIYIHEMGHVIALRRLGFKATAPMFIPGFGALIRLQQQVVNAREDAEIGLAGPIYGLGAAIAALALWAITRHPIFAAIAVLGAIINLFNLIPIGTLDGGRGFHAFSRFQKWIAVASVVGMWALTHGGVLGIVGLVGAYRAVIDPVNHQRNNRAIVTYVVLVLLLTAVMYTGLHIARLNE